MRIKEIKERYPNEWLLIAVDKFDKEYAPLEGNVILHSPSKDVIYEMLLKVKGKNLAIEYAGKIPKDLSVLL